MAEKGKEGAINVDGWVQKVLKYVTGAISSFVAFLFFLFTLGAVYGALVIMKGGELSTYLIIAPALVGLFAYYSRALSLVLFALLILFFIII